MVRNVIYIVIAILYGCMVPEKQITQTPVEQALEEAKRLKLSDSSGTTLAAFEKACDLGANYGCLEAGLAYHNGLYGVNKNYELAKEWYLKSAHKGYIYAQVNLAQLYLHTKIQPLDDVEGYKWALLAERNAIVCRPQDIWVDLQPTNKQLNSFKTEEGKRLCQLALEAVRGISAAFRNRTSIEQRKQAAGLADQWWSRER